MVFYENCTINTEMSVRLLLTEGIFTILLGIFTYFFLADCR
jgi:hypothetical protein